MCCQCETKASDNRFLFLYSKNVTVIRLSDLEIDGDEKRLHLVECRLKWRRTTAKSVFFFFGVLPTHDEPLNKWLFGKQTLFSRSFCFRAGQWRCQHINFRQWRKEKRKLFLLLFFVPSYALKRVENVNLFSATQQNCCVNTNQIDGRWKANQFDEQSKAKSLSKREFVLKHIVADAIVPNHLERVPKLSEQKHEKEVPNWANERKRKKEAKDKAEYARDVTKLFLSERKTCGTNFNVAESKSKQFSSFENSSFLHHNRSDQLIFCKYLPSRACRIRRCHMLGLARGKWHSIVICFLSAFFLSFFLSFSIVLIASMTSVSPLAPPTTASYDRTLSRSLALF